MSWFSVWWVWFVIAAALGVLEMLVPSFLALGFAIGALGVAALVGFGPVLSSSVLLVVFSALSLVAWILLRQIFKLPTGQVKTFDQDIND